MTPEHNHSGRNDVVTELLAARAFLAQGQIAQAKSVCDAMLQRAPSNFDVLYLSGAVYVQTLQLAEAVDLLCRAIAVRTSSHSSYNLLGYAMSKLSQYAAAIECFDKALALNPACAEAACNRGNALHTLGRNQDALQSYALATQIDPKYSAAWSNRGNTLLALGRVPEAIASFDHALAIDPRAAASYLNRGNAYLAAGDAARGLANYDQALALNPNQLMAHSNRGNALKRLQRFEEAIESYNRALALDPEHADTYWNRGLTHLLLGDMHQGFADYQWRWKRVAFAPIVREFHQPMWLGDTPLQGKTLLLHAEQGLGDTLQFVRYTQILADLGARVVLEAEPALFALFAGLSGVQQLVCQGQTLPEFDLHCPLLTLPLALRTSLDYAVQSVPYLHADADLRVQWNARLGARHQLRVGLVWSGSVTHQDDHNRSIPLAELLSSLPSGPRYISLQKEVRPDDLAALQASGLTHFGDQLHSFSDTAALCSCMDVVISVDTSVAHLSGALGQTTWILLPHLPDWRWLLERRDSPWYPSARLYRQAQARDWTVPLTQICADLRALRI